MYEEFRSLDTRQTDGSLKMRVTSFAVPLSTVRHVEVQQRDGAKLALLIIGVGAPAFVVIVVIGFAITADDWGGLGQFLRGRSSQAGDSCFVSR
jgi:hypothetical protein